MLILSLTISACLQTQTQKYNQFKQVKVKPCLAKIPLALPPPPPQLLGLQRGGLELVVDLSSTIKPSLEDCLDNSRLRPPLEVGTPLYLTSDEGFIYFFNFLQGSLELKQPLIPSARRATTPLVRLLELEVSIFISNLT